MADRDHRNVYVYILSFHGSDDDLYRLFLEETLYMPGAHDDPDPPYEIYTYIRIIRSPACVDLPSILEHWRQQLLKLQSALEAGKSRLLVVDEDGTGFFFVRGYDSLTFSHQLPAYALSSSPETCTNWVPSPIRGRKRLSNWVFETVPKRYCNWLYHPKCRDGGRWDCGFLHQ